MTATRQKPYPKILKRLLSQLERKGYPAHKAFPVAIKALQKSGNLKPGTREATRQGARRGNLTAKQRQANRAKRYGHPTK